MGIKIVISGDKEVSSFLVKMPKEVNDQIDKEIANFMRDVQKSAKLRAPRLTGETALSIKFDFGKSPGSYVVYVDSPAAYYQEMGFTPHYVWSFQDTKYGNTFGDMYGLPFGRYWVSKNKPFLAPALELNLARINTRLADAAQRGLNK